MGSDLFSVRDDGTWTAFICTCSEEGIIEAGKLKQEVRKLLSEGFTSPCTVSNFLTRVVVSLNWDYDAYITTIGNDMWSGIHAKSDDGLEVYVQCDEVEDGIAAIWYAFWLRKEQDGEREAPGPDRGPAVQLDPGPRRQRALPADGDRGAEAGAGDGGGERAERAGCARPDGESAADGQGRSGES